MTHEDRLDRLRALFKAFGETGDVSTLIDQCTDDVVYRVTVAPGTPISGDWVGKDGVARYFEVMNATVRHDGFNVYGFFASDDGAVVTGDETLYIHHNGATFFTDWATVFTFRGEQISKILVIENLGPLGVAYGHPEGMHG
jgi:ketosteroid isomerase-like protein